MTGESRLADLQCVYQFTHAQFPAPESSNNANACRIYDSLPKGGKVSHYLLYIGICRYIKRDVNHEKTMLIVFGGSPGVGTTTLAKAVARELEAVYLFALRIPPGACA